MSTSFKVLSCVFCETILKSVHGRVSIQNVIPLFQMSPFQPTFFRFSLFFTFFSAKEFSQNLALRIHMPDNVLLVPFHSTSILPNHVAFIEVNDIACSCLAHGDLKVFIQSDDGLDHFIGENIIFPYVNSMRSLKNEEKKNKPNSDDKKIVLH